MTEMTSDVALALRRPFPPESVGKLPKGGIMLDYVGHAAVTDRLLTVDPNWSWEPFALTEDGLPALDKAGNLWIRLTVCGVTRIGVGDGKNAKEVIGDAIRNAAMRFGVALDLWAKENLVEFAQAAGATPVQAKAEQAPRRTMQRKPPTSGAEVAPPDGKPGKAAPDVPSPTSESAPEVPSITQAQLKKLHALANDLGLDREQKLAGVAAVIGREVESTNDLTKAEAVKVIDRMEAKLNDDRADAMAQAVDSPADLDPEADKQIALDA